VEKKNTWSGMEDTMADGYDRFENEGGGGGSFVMGLLTGTVLGAGLGMLFAPKAGSELRSQLSDQAGNLANTASEGYRRVQETASGLADRGRDAYDRAREAVNRGTEEAQRYVRDASSGQSSSTSSSSSVYGSGSENIRGGGSSSGTPSGGSHSGGFGSGGDRG
jgi:gas vesicle protein